MTAETPQELQGLISPSPSTRAKAAGWLLQHPGAITTRALMNALQSETVPQVRSLLLRVQEHRQRAAGSARDDADTDTQTVGVRLSDEELSASDHVDIASMIRHELSPAVGWIRLAADSEIESFGSSKTNDAVRKLQRRIDGLVTIIKSGEELHLGRLSLPHVLTETWPDTGNVLVVVPTADEQTIEIETDEGLFCILLLNVFQNAIDASVDAVGKVEVHVTWGFTDESYWVRIANPFSRVRFSLTDVLPIGNSSKPAHQGRGLPLIKTVADRLGLAIRLEGISGTACFSLSGHRPHD